MRAFWKLPKMATMQREPIQNAQFGPKNKIALNMRKLFLQTHSSCSMQKKCSKKQLILEKWEQFENCKENGHNARALAHGNYPGWEKN